MSRLSGTAAYGMFGTELGYGATSAYGMSGTELAYGLRDNFLLARSHARTCPDLIATVMTMTLTLLFEHVKHRHAFDDNMVHLDP
eukprot:2543897-Rhodomonas_salina.1